MAAYIQNDMIDNEEDDWYKEARRKLEECAFELIQKEGLGFEPVQLTSDMIESYAEEVAEYFGDNPYECETMMEDMFCYDDYTDPASGVTMSWENWAQFFCNYGGSWANQTVYEELCRQKELSTKMAAELEEVGELRQRLAAFLTKGDK